MHLVGWGVAARYIFETPNSLRCTTGTLNTRISSSHPISPREFANVHAQYVSKTLAQQELTILSDMVAGPSTSQRLMYSVPAQQRSYAWTQAGQTKELFLPDCHSFHKPGTWALDSSSAQQMVCPQDDCNMLCALPLFLPVKFSPGQLQPVAAASFAAFKELLRMQKAKEKPATCSTLLCHVMHGKAVKTWRNSFKAQRWHHSSSDSSPAGGIRSTSVVTTSERTPLQMPKHLAVSRYNRTQVCRLHTSNPRHIQPSGCLLAQTAHHVVAKCLLDHLGCTVAGRQKQQVWPVAPAACAGGHMQALRPKFGAEIVCPGGQC